MQYAEYVQGFLGYLLLTGLSPQCFKLLGASSIASLIISKELSNELEADSPGGLEFHFPYLKS